MAVRVGKAVATGARVELAGPVHRTVLIDSTFPGLRSDHLFEDLPLGAYTLRASHPDFDSPAAQQIRFDQPRCASASVSLSSPSTVSGRLVDSAGGPLASVTVVLFPSPRKLNETVVFRRTDAAGNVEFKSLVPGRYRFALASHDPDDARPNRIVVPPCDMPQVIEVKPRMSIRGLTIQCRPAGRLREVRLKVVSRATGKPIPHASLDTPLFGRPSQDPRERQIFGRLTDADGVYRLMILSGAYVELYACRWRDGVRAACSEPVVAGLNGPADFTLFLP
jgi:hypothetical protein